MCRPHVRRPRPTALKLRGIHAPCSPGLTHWPGIGGQTYRQSALADGIDDVFVPRWQRLPPTRHRNTFIAPSEWDGPAPSVGSTKRRGTAAATREVNKAQNLLSATYLPGTPFSQAHPADSYSSASRPTSVVNSNPSRPRHTVGQSRPCGYENNPFGGVKDHAPSNDQQSDHQ